MPSLASIILVLGYISLTIATKVNLLYSAGCARVDGKAVCEPNLHRRTSITVKGHCAPFVVAHPDQDRSVEKIVPCRTGELRWAPGTENVYLDKNACLVDGQGETIVFNNQKQCLTAPYRGHTAVRSPYLKDADEASSPASYGPSPQLATYTGSNDGKDEFFDQSPNSQ